MPILWETPFKFMVEDDVVVKVDDQQEDGGWGRGGGGGESGTNNFRDGIYSIMPEVINTELQDRCFFSSILSFVCIKTFFVSNL